MRKPVLLVIGAAALVGAGSYGWNWYSNGRFLEETDNATVRSDVVTVAPKVPGYVAQLPVTDNQRVSRGDVLMVIDTADYRASVAKADAALQASRASVTVVDRQMALARSQVHEAEAALESAQADLTRTSEDLARYETLNKRQFASTQTYQAAQADHRKAEAAVRQAKAAVETSMGQLDLLAAERAQAEATVAQSEAALEEARIALDNTRVIAATDGVIGNLGVEAGQYIAAGRQAMSLVPVDEVYVVANFKETQLEHMTAGQAVDIHVDAYPDRTFAGVVDSVSPGSGAVFSLLPPDNATGNYTKIVQRVPVKIRLVDGTPTDALLVPGMSVIASVDTRTGHGTGSDMADGAGTNTLTTRTAFIPESGIRPDSGIRGSDAGRQTATVPVAANQEN